MKKGGKGERLKSPMNWQIGPKERKLKADEMEWECQRWQLCVRGGLSVCVCVCLCVCLSVICVCVCVFWVCAHHVCLRVCL